jgi:hypothetical protein
MFKRCQKGWMLNALIQQGFHDLVGIGSVSSWETMMDEVHQIQKTNVQMKEASSACRFATHVEIRSIGCIYPTGAIL